ncbi:hypothetical protein BHAOGJBA_4457 [Methylobacterium hispanicum]|uniref:Uncharacterized protein n=1 Tax=Methylobacterium hispanicum TaxID=270350 RepID=A0AAV4ZS46_9HYPH|nr:hypothetical protein [Methylobacterium hispanicum]GJD90913.1 hypothetical protein BHAOGJBA_4457 [Methylobacterium hispanicum]
MGSGAKIAGALAFCLGLQAPMSAPRAMTLEALCAQDHVAREVVRFSKKLRYPADARGMKPDMANFDKEAGPMSCVFGLTAGNAYDFGNYKATFEDAGRNQVRAISLSPIN